MGERWEEASVMGCCKPQHPRPVAREGRIRAPPEVSAFGVRVSPSGRVSRMHYLLVTWSQKAFQHPHSQGLRPLTQPAPCLPPLCRARILFLLQLLADHVPGIGLVTSKHEQGHDDD